jgi:hypothetical protein
MSAFPSTAFNIQVIGSGNNAAPEKVGTIPPATGMPVYIAGFPYTPQRFILQVDPNTGLVTVGASGATGDALSYATRNNPWEVNVWINDAKGYAWPTGVNNTIYANTTFVQPTSQVRGFSFLPGTGLLYG